ncbi:MAG: OmpH family outer membrane protein [Candidatus Gastranaerophilaceae bacterium]|jgi:hypothetical protein|uniref:OmpH family outer membrane protein n=1 Tax=Candidatus Limenecus avicola TaxID=2840847 RepID=A0A9D1SR06_9CLOT|nr:OmpH family outer membrane protein [Clostridium sp.]CDC17976.1 outer membrane protein OmpH-like protein [Clostridium sp. CAG:306]DAB21136.1 MAG TPA: hypothetical protein CPT85_08300 [Candidatus Gastranaerophilales bacterium HUM_21]HIU91586.1 OmpH family outer membrane protein [Candidatus Limenecus avicola]
MKKLLTLIALLALATPVLAADKYASVDIDKVLKGYKKTEAINKDFQKREADIRVFIVDAQKSVVAATTDADRKKLEEKYAKELKSKMDKLQQDKIKALQGIENNVKKAIQAEGQKGTYALILTSNNALYGTVDISDSIIKTLNAAP